MKPKEDTFNSLDELVGSQVSLLRSGKPLEAFDEFYDEAVQMYANDMIFASGFAVGRSIQEPYVATARDIHGCITDVAVFREARLCVFRNRSRFISGEGNTQQIDGLCCQKWRDDKIVEERYYDGQCMKKWIDQGVLTDTTVLEATFCS